jgi:hypothetical protein
MDAAPVLNYLAKADQSTFGALDFLERVVSVSV